MSKSYLTIAQAYTKLGLAGGVRLGFESQN